MSDIIKTGYLNAGLANKDGFLQKIDPRIKLFFLIYFLIIISMKHDLWSEFIIAWIVLFLALVSRLNVLRLYKKIIFFGFIFGFVIALPSSLNLFRPGMIIFPLIKFSKVHRLWVYNIPSAIGFTQEGVLGVVMLTFRVMNSLALTFLIVATTRFEEFIMALKILKIPDAVLVIITLMYKYIFIFTQTVQDMYLSRKSRSPGNVDNKQNRAWMLNRMVFLFKKTQKKYEEIFHAMISRGFTDEIILYDLEKIDRRSIIVGTGFFIIGVLLLWG